MGKPRQIDRKQFLLDWEKAKAEGTTRHQHAKALGISWHTLKQQIIEFRRDLGLKGCETLTDRLKSGETKHDLEKVEQERDGNTLEVTSKSNRIRTLEELLEVCDVDLDVWNVDRYVINKWEVGAKDDDGNIVVEPLFQVKAWLIPKVAEPIEFAVQPVTIKFGRRTNRPRTRKDNFLVAVCLFDAHVGFERDIHTGKLTPFHDRLALDIGLQICEYLEPDLVFYGGDWGDFPDWSDKFVRSPEMYWTTQPTIYEMAWWLGQYTQVCDDSTKHIYIEGNHEVRLTRAFMTHAASAWKLSPANSNALVIYSMPNLLGLDELGIEYLGGYPKNEYWITDNVMVCHGDVVSGVPGNTSGRLVKSGVASVVFGHIHRAEYVTRQIRTGAGDAEIQAMCPGCLCRTDGIVPGSKPGTWTQGVGLIYLYDNGAVEMQRVPIVNGTATLSGHVFTGDEKIDQLVQDTGWQF